MQKTYLCDAGQVDSNRLLDRLNPLQSLLELHPGLGEIRLHGESSPPKNVPELHLMLIPKDEPNINLYQMDVMSAFLNGYINE